MLIGEAVMPIDIAHVNHNNVIATVPPQVHNLIAAFV